MPTDTPNTRINAIEQIEGALKMLSAYGYDVSSVWADHNAWLNTLDSREVTDEDRKWASQAPEAAPTSEHFINGEPELLTSARCHVGRQYTLTPGQRDVLRERYGLTPTMVVTAENVELYPTEDVIWSLTLRSVEHVDPRRRRHVLNSVVLAPASAFFRDAATKDKEREDEAVARDEDKQAVVRSVRKNIALQYI